MDVVVMPAKNRPEMAALALEKIAGCPESQKLEVRIYVDLCDDERMEEFEYVRDKYYPTAILFRANEHIEAPSGCWNILMALRSGYNSGAERIFLIEEDVMVYPDYFRWNYEHEGNFFATCGRLRKEHSSDYYTNPGACFKADKLGYVIPHICDAYFSVRREYLDKTFGVMPEASDLDDGLIRRVIRQQDSWVLYPEKAIVAHQGFHYYQKLHQYKNEGTIVEKIDHLRDILICTSSEDRYARDFEPYRPDERL